jgi:hypothetical protein
MLLQAVGQSALASDTEVLKKAVERELKLLGEQETTLVRRQEKLESDKAALIRKAKASVRSQESSLLENQANSEKLAQEVKSLAEDKNRLMSREENLNKLWTRSMKTLGINESKYYLKPQDEILVPPVPENLMVGDLKEVWEKSLALLQQVQSLQSLEVEVNSENGVQRLSALRWGGLGIFGRDQEKESQVLGPGNERELVRLGEANLGGGRTGIFLFDGLSGTVLIKKHLTWLDRIADQIPLLILGLMLLVVLFIFTKLARV